MKPQFIIIAILITLKIIGVAIRANAISFIPGYTCNYSTTFQINCGGSGYGSWNISSNDILCNSNTELKCINNYINPVYRCGNSPSIKRI